MSRLMPDLQKPHPWRFFRAGGFDRKPRFRDRRDPRSSHQLDQKLWVALACPVAGLDFDARTGALVDTDNDGRIRAPELIAAAQWAAALLKNPDLLIQGGDSLRLDAISDASAEGRQILAAARGILTALGKPNEPAITLEEAINAKNILDATPFNGDGVIVAESADDLALRAVIGEIADAMGAINDRSGKPGIDQERLDKFFAEAAAFDAWMRQSESPAIMPAGPATPAAAAAVNASKAKVDDYFARCRLAAYDPRAAASLNPKEEDYAALAASPLGADAAPAAKFPLAQIAAGKALLLRTGINPAHASAINALLTDAIRPLLDERNELTEADWEALQGKLAAYQKWNSEKAGAAVEKLGVDRVRTLLAGSARASLRC